MKIYPVISVTHLEPAPHGKDPYNRPRDDYLSSIEKLIDRRYGRNKKFIEYLVKWRGYGPEFCE